MADLLSRHNDVLAPVIAFNTKIHAVSADGLWITDPDGNRWADFACGTAVTNLGHRHPAVVEAYLEGSLAPQWNRPVSSRPAGTTIAERKTMRLLRRRA